MISDAPYQFGEQVLTFLGGVVAGLIGGMSMLAFVFALQPVSGLLLKDLLVRFGTVALLGETRFEENIVLIAGVALLEILGALFGLLYAGCQQRIPARGIIGVSVFYGFMLWVVGSLLISSLFGQTIRATVRSWTWLLACLIYGLCLAAAAILSDSRSPAGTSLSVPMD